MSKIQLVYYLGILYSNGVKIVLFNKITSFEKTR